MFSARHSAASAQAFSRVDGWRAAAVAVGTSLLFLLLYGGASYITSLRSDVGSWYYAWERFIPFVPAMIVPYMSIDLFFVIAPFICGDRAELRVLAWRLSVAIVAATACFLIFPLQLAVERPHAQGFFGPVYNWFTSMDRPFNLSPSLHIALRTILAAHFARHCRGLFRVGMHGWFVLIGLSTLLLYQHHVIDVVAGFVLAVLVMYCFDGLPWRVEKTDSRRIGFRYAISGLSCLLPVLVVPQLGWALLWPAAALLLTAAGYVRLGPAIYRRINGRLTWPCRLLLGPVIAGQWLSWKYYRRRSPVVDAVADGVYIGRHMTAKEAAGFSQEEDYAVVDVCNAFDEPRSHQAALRLELPVLDLTAPTSNQLSRAADFIEEQRKNRKVLVHCKAGYSRSAALVAAWLLHTHRATSVCHAISVLKQVRPAIVIRPEIEQALHAWYRAQQPEAIAPSSTATQAKLLSNSSIRSSKVQPVFSHG